MRLNKGLVVEWRHLWLRMIDHVQEEQYSGGPKSIESLKEGSETKIEMGRTLQVIFDEM